MVRLKDPHHLDDRPKSRLGQLNPFNRDRSEPMSAPVKSDIKETFKRPLSSK